MGYLREWLLLMRAALRVRSRRSDKKTVFIAPLGMELQAGRVESMINVGRVIDAAVPKLFFSGPPLCVAGCDAGNRGRAHRNLALPAAGKKWRTNLMV